jgi:5-(carboxyamino)imidazole ribonucleotide synthase
MVGSLIHTGKPLTVGILGGGQLAKMLAQAAYRLGLNVAIIEHGEESPAGVMTHQNFPLGWTNNEELEKFIAVCDYVTLENEFIAPDILDYIAEKRPVFPSPATIRLVQDKLTQKQTMKAAGIPVPQFAGFSSPEEAVVFGEENEFPFIIKTRKFGYDGYGNATVKSRHEITMAWRRFRSGDAPRDLMGERFISFEKELAVMVARNQRKEYVVYPCVETIQKNHICHEVVAPAGIDEDIQKRAQGIALAAVEAIDGIGVFGVELFLCSDGSILFNEIAPRPHNSGHYTIEACVTSQFENCLRAVCNYPLGSTSMHQQAAVMINLLGIRSGQGVPDSVVDFFKCQRASLHLYGKKDSRVGRKMGHITVLGEQAGETRQYAQKAADNIVW